MATNPYINKVEYGGNVLIDLTQDTVTADVLVQGYSAHDKSGAVIAGGIPIQTSEELTAAGPTVTVPSGFYAIDAHKTIGAGSATTPATTVTIAPGIAVSTSGLITATIATTTEAIIPTVVAGYVSQGTTGNVTISGSATNQLSTQAAKTITPTEAVQTAVASGQFTTGVVKVAAISSNYVGSNIAQRTSTDLTVNGATITAPAGYYAAAATATVSAGSATTPDTSIAAVPTATLNTSTGVVSFSVSTSSNVTPTVSAGYITTGTSGTITVSGSSSLALSTQAAKTVTPTESAQIVVAAGKYTTGAVTVAAISSDYVGSNITRMSSADLTVSGATVTAPAGYYASSAVATVGSGSAKTPATSIIANPAFSFNATTGVITATTSSSKSVTPTVTAGYVTSGTAGTISVSGSSTYTLTSSTFTEGTTTVSGTTATRGTLEITQGWTAAKSEAAATFANSATSGTTYVDISNTTDAPVLVSGSYLFINKGYTDNLKISLARLVPDGASADLASNKILSGYAAYDNNGALVAGNIPSKAAATYTPTTTDQTIASGQYLSSAQTIKGDANLVADKIRSGYSIFGVAGSYVGTTVSYTETDNEYGGKTVTITVTEPAAAS